MGLTLAKWSLTDYHRTIEAGVLAGRKVELIGGDIVEMAPEGPLHRYTNASVLDYLKQLLGDRAQVLPPGPIELSADGSEPEPDVAVVAPLGTIYMERLPRSEDFYWVVEVSKTTVALDLGRKAEMYARNSIGEYWVLDVEQRQLWIHREPVDGDYTSKVMQQCGTVSPLAFPEIEISVERLFVGKDV
ncbi:Uma2 family endonuclease [Synechococcus sp. PCC 7336]|uniref:Uma2 family endonuclease n=1 Tax=Synechococcus sp. PCC 7336 TaxID=195250 RepID=UPI0003468DB0|nr:Uma2 family endonuclease [Synechococcus sp. PCC 7336]